MRLISNGVRPRRLSPLLGIFAALVLANSAHADTTSVNDNTIGTDANQFQYVGGADWTYEQRGDAYQGEDYYDAVAGDYYQVTFSGTQAQIYTTKDYVLGIMGVSIDGGGETMVDLYSPGRLTQQLVYTSPTLPNGIHTLKVRVTGSKNPASFAAYVVADRVDVTTPSETVLRRLDFEQNGTTFDGTNGSVAYSTDQAYSGSGSAKILMQADSINRGWMWQDPSDYCAGSGTNDVNTFAPVGSNRSISGEFYITDPKDTVGERLLALSYDNGDCLGQPTGSILTLDLDGGSVHLKSSDYGGDCPGCNATDFSPWVDITSFANQWVNLEVRVHVARDNTGWAQLVVNGHAYPIVYGPTLTTSWGNYNEIQWGAGWAEPGTATQYLYLDNATLASF